MGSNLDLRFVAPHAGAWIETNPKSRFDPISRHLARYLFREVEVHI